MGNAPSPDAKPGIVAMICLVSIEPIKEQAQIESALAQTKQCLSNAIQTVLQIASPFEDAVQSCLRNLHVYDKA